MIIFFLCVFLLIGGYFVYGAVVERVFGIEPDRQVPAYTRRDNVDFLPMPTWKVFLIQLLNIAGIGPVFGPILGALYGPQALLWIVIGTIFAGGVHDFLSGILSVRSGGNSIPEIVGDELGRPVRHVLRFFSLLLLVLVGVIFVSAPAELIAPITGLDLRLLVALIFAYYFLATILPIDKIIGRFYPVFGGLLLFMSLGIIVALFLSNHPVLPNTDFFANVNPQTSYDGRQLPVWPLMFITISCGALSGFHSTQSPMMARCLNNERRGRLVFYGTMVAEGIIALIWATVGMSFYGSPGQLSAVIQAGTPSAVVEEVAHGLLGHTGSLFAVLGVAVLPITSGDTAFRAARLILAESFGMRQDTNLKRLSLAIPLFLVGIAISLVDFSVIWRYFGWSNQMLSALALWSGALWLARRGKCHWIATVPAVFMTAVTVTFILYMKIGFGLPYCVSTIAGAVLALLSLGVFLYRGLTSPPPRASNHDPLAGTPASPSRPLTRSIVMKEEGSEISPNPSFIKRGE